MPFEIQWIRRRPRLAAPTDGANPKEAFSRPLFIAICSVFSRKCLVKKMVQNEQNLHRPFLHKMQYVSIEIAVVGYFFESGRLRGYRPLPPTVGSIGLLSLQKYRPKIIFPFTYVLQILLPEYLVLIKEDYVIYSVNVNSLVGSGRGSAKTRQRYHVYWDKDMLSYRKSYTWAATPERAGGDSVLAGCIMAKVLQKVLPSALLTLAPAGATFDAKQVLMRFGEHVSAYWRCCTVLCCTVLCNAMR